MIWVLSLFIFLTPPQNPQDTLSIPIIDEILKKANEPGCKPEVIPKAFGGEDTLKYKTFNPISDIKWSEFNFKWHMDIKVEGLRIDWDEGHIELKVKLADAEFWLPNSLVDVTTDYACWASWNFDLPESPKPPFTNTWGYQVIDLSRGEKQGYNIILPLQAHVLYLYPWKIAGEIYLRILKYATDFVNEVYCDILTSLGPIGIAIGALTGIQIEANLKSFDGEAEHYWDYQNNQRYFKPFLPVYFSDYDYSWQGKDIDISIPGQYGQYVNHADWSYYFMLEPYVLPLYQLVPQLSSNWVGLPLTLESIDCLRIMGDTLWKKYIKPHIGDPISVPGVITLPLITLLKRYTLGCWDPLFPFIGYAYYQDYLQSQLANSARALWKFYAINKKSPTGWHTIDRDWLKVQTWAPKKIKSVQVGYSTKKEPLKSLWKNSDYTRKGLGTIWWQKFTSKVTIVFYGTIRGDGACSDYSGDGSVPPMDDNFINFQDYSGFYQQFTTPDSFVGNWSKIKDICDELFKGQ